MRKKSQQSKDTNIMRFVKFILLILVLLTLASCRNKRTVTTLTNTETIVTEKIDTTVTIVGDSISKVMPLNLSLGFTHVVEHDLAIVKVTIDTLIGTLKTDVVIPDRDVDVSMEKTTTTRVQEEQVIVEVTKPCNCPRGLWWKIPLLCIAVLLVGVGIGKIVG